ncbi:MAG: hypothetical protein AB1489_24540 [Acidobacteriota bacterium]
MATIKLFFFNTMVLVNGNPSVNINATHDIVGAWKLGVPNPRHRV